MVKNLRNLVFVSGPHGSGKSTLIKKLVEVVPNSISPKLKTKTPQFYWGRDKDVIETNHSHRQALKAVQRATENYEYWMEAIKNPEKTIIGDRCIRDSRVYRKAGVNMGQITKAENDEIEKTLPIFYSGGLLDPQAIILNPGFDICKRHLEKRWRETGWVKFEEKDFEYLRAVCDAFEEFEGRPRFFYIGKERDLTKEDALEDVKEWIEGLRD